MLTTHKLNQELDDADKLVLRLHEFLLARRSKRLASETQFNNSTESVTDNIISLPQPFQQQEAAK